jgi:hypothetical protein
MQGSKNEWKRRRYESSYGRMSNSWELGDFNKKIRHLDISVDVPDGGYFKKVDVFFEWGT